MVALCLLLLGASKTAPMVDFRKGINYALTPIQTALMDSTRSVTSVFSTITQIEQLRQENEALQTRVQQLLEEEQRVESVRIQNEQLTTLLGVKSSLDYDTSAATVIGRQSSPEERIIVIDRGANDGIVEGDPVLGGEGALVGAITEVDPTSSICTLLTDTRSVVIGLIESSRASGEVHGRLTSILSMTNIPSTETLAVGDRVVTAGIDIGADISSPFPPGLLIGNVVEVESLASAIVQSALIDPAADMEKLEYVLVITNFERPTVPSPGASTSPSITPQPSGNAEPGASHSPSPTP